MEIIIVTHPERFGALSISKFSQMIANAMRDRGHSVSITKPQDILTRPFRKGHPMRKWAGYFDDYVLFNAALRFKALGRRLRGKKALYVIADQALGMLVPAVTDLPHVVHCHDFLAQRSAQGEFPENPTGRSGAVYQTLIRKGYSKAKAFISISRATQKDLHKMLGYIPPISEVVPNALNFEFSRINLGEAGKIVAGLKQTTVNLCEGFLMHVGGDQWYKNRRGVLKLFIAYRRELKKEGREDGYPLVLVGPKPAGENEPLLAEAQAHGPVIVISGVSNEELRALYNLSKALVFPSLEEGFGWPLLEALACGTPVLTTDKQPMTEVCGKAGAYIERMEMELTEEWAAQGAARLIELLNESESEKSARMAEGFEHIKSFTNEATMDGYEDTYEKAWNLMS